MWKVIALKIAWKRIKSKFVKKNNFTGFRVELYREGKLMVTQLGHVDQTLVFNVAHNPFIFEDIRCHGYTLTPHIEQGKII